MKKMTPARMTGLYPGKSRIAIILAVFGILVVIFIVFYLFFSSPQLGRQETTKTTRSSIVFQTIAPKPDQGHYVSKKVTVQDGGKLELTDQKGVKVTFAIPPGALKRDTTISISPLLEVPIKNYTSALGNGVLIEPEGLEFNKLALLTFDFKPESNPAKTFSRSLEDAGNPHVKLAQNFNLNDLENLTNQLKTIQKQAEQINSAGGQGSGIPTVITSAPTVPRNTLSAATRVIHIEHDKRRVSLEPTSLSTYGSQILVGVKRLSSHVPDVIEGDKAGDFLEDGLGGNATNYGSGGCDSEALSALLWLPMASTMLDGDSLPDLRAIADKCIDEQIKYLENLCRNDRVALRRRHFTALIELIQAFGLSKSKQDKVVKLMLDCRGQYELKGESSASLGEGTLTLAVGAKVCGYPDEEWNGTESLDYFIPTQLGPAGNGYENVALKFFLPPEPGGYTSDVHGMTFARQLNRPPLQIPYEGPGHYGVIYDKENVEMTHWYGGDGLKIETKIKMIQDSCDKPDPLAELLRS